MSDIVAFENQVVKQIVCCLRAIPGSVGLSENGYKPLVISIWPNKTRISRPDKVDESHLTLIKLFYNNVSVAIRQNVRIARTIPIEAGRRQGDIGDDAQQKQSREQGRLEHIQRRPGRSAIAATAHFHRIRGGGSGLDAARHAARLRRQSVEFSSANGKQRPDLGQQWRSRADHRVVAEGFAVDVSVRRFRRHQLWRAALWRDCRD